MGAVGLRPSLKRWPPHPNQVAGPRFRRAGRQGYQASSLRPQYAFGLDQTAFVSNPIASHLAYSLCRD